MSNYDYREKSQDKYIIDSFMGWFNIYIYLPTILTVATGLLFFIFSIIDIAVLKGIMGIESEFLSLLVWWIIGAIVCAIEYCLSKISCSHKIIQIYLLKKISAQSEQIVDCLDKDESDMDAKGNNTKSYRPTYTPAPQKPKYYEKGWTCKQCGTENPITALVCSGCGEYR